MSWWTSLKEKASAAGNGIVGGAQWFWNNATVANVSSSLFKFTVNTTFHILEQGLALRKAVPTLIYNEQARKVINGMTYVVVHDVLPVVALNTLNSSVQNYFRNGYEENEASAAYSLLVSVLTLGNYLVTAYTWRRGTETFVRVAVLDAFAPAAFNSNRTIMPPSLCDELECNTQRKLKGAGRELGILWANEALIGGISYLPYVGTPVSKALTVVNNGRYINRSVASGCERHKYMEQEFVLALGLTYELASWLMDKGLDATTGPIPYLYLRTLRHILLALSVNLAAHMSLPVVLPKDATIIDPFYYYERSWRFLIDVFWAGLLKRVPIDFKPIPGEAPFLPLSTALQLGTRIFNSDLEREGGTNSYPLARKIKDLIIPPMFRTAYDFPKDPVLAEYWPAIREGAIGIFSAVETHGKTNLVATMAWSPKSAAFILDLKFGIPGKLTKIVLMLSEEKDFWALTHAIRGWFERHPSTTEIRLVQPKTPLLALRDDKPLALPLPISLEPTQTVAAAEQLLSEKPRPPLVEEDVLRLRPVRKAPTVSVDNPLMFMSTRRRRNEVGSKIEEIPDEANLGLH